ncbi:MAG TPA: hypothetical protein VNQ90_10165 [Chthoniobacteraceae bacterium]|nr:hypothetical protein [Chthoniobacteraceae bacterium]
MNTVLFIAGSANLVAALVCIGVSLPFALRKVKVSNRIGVRIRKSYLSVEHWKKINAYFSRWLILWSLPVLLVGVTMVVGAFKFPGAFPGWSAFWLNLSLLLLLLPPVQTLMWSRNLPS